MDPQGPGAGGLTLQRIVLDFRSGELLVRCLYRTNRGPNPGTKARQREVQELTRSGLQDALDALEGRVDVVGVSGYDVREDTLSLPRPDEPAAARRAAS